MNTHTKYEPARLADSPEDYARFKLARCHIEQWEDGIRLDPGAPNIEWWYFDCLLDDGANLAVTFATKDASRAHQPLEPLIEIDLDLPDGRRFMKYGRFKVDEFEASKDGCDVRMGKYRFVGDLHQYTITGAAEDLSAEVQLVGTTEPWRPETGHMVFGLEGQTIFGWAPVVPMGNVKATYRIGAEVHDATGTGYHDHNWMNKGFPHLVDHWYWGRGQVGPFAFTTAYITAAKPYGYTTIPLYMLARDGKVIADDGAKVTFSKSESQIDKHTGKPIPDAICFDYQDGDTRYELTYTRQKTLVTQKFLDLAKGVQKVVAELLRYPGGYLRFSGPVSLVCYQGGKVVEHYEDTGSFEECYQAAEIHDD